MSEMTFKISGMHCAACSSGIERFLSRREEVEAVSVNLATERMLIRFDGAALSAEGIIELVEKLGYGCKIYSSAEAAKEEKLRREENARETKLLLRRAIIAVCFALPLLYISMGHMLGAPLPAFMSMHSTPAVYALVQLALTLPILVCGRNFYSSGYPALFRLRPNMDSLVAVGTTAAFLFSIYVTVRVISGDSEYIHSICFESSAVVVAFVMLGKGLEARSKARTGEAISRLTELAPDTARVSRDGETLVIPAEELREGDIVTVLPGERFPCDGLVSSGSSSVDLSMLTGESLPVTVEPGCAVTGGSINLEAKLVFSATRTGADTALSGIIRMVEEAQSKKAPIARLADTVALYFVPAVIAIAILSSAAWAIAGKDFEFVLNIFVSVLVIACPCSLGLATPTAIMAGTGRGAELKILYKSGEALQELSRINTAVLDKTGTVTEGRLTVTELSPAPGFDDAELLRLAASAESASLHPLAKAIVSRAEELGLELIPAGQSKAIPGRGIVTELSGRSIMAGSAAMLSEAGVDTGNIEPPMGASLVYIAVDGVFAGLIAAADSIKADSANAVAQLKKLGVDCVMLTGDAQSAAEKICAEAGIDSCCANVLPGDKASEVEALRADGRRVVMVGDGINDAPALAAADVGVAIGSGTDVAIESADVVLMLGSLTGLPTALRLSRAVIRNIKQNLFWAFFYNCCGIPFAAGLVYALGGPLLPPMFAGAAMALSSLTVVSNALRLKRFK